MKKRMVLLSVAALMTVSMAFPASAGSWDQDEKGYWYVNDSGSYARDQMMVIDGVNYAFDQQAYMVKGWYQQEGNWYYFSPETGAQVTGWTQIDGKWYYLNPGNSGIMHKSWLNQGGNRYYLDETGAMKTGAFTVGGFYYFAEPNGVLRRNVIDKENGITIRYDDEGKEWYKNEESAINTKNGGDSWLPVLENVALQIQRAEIRESNADFIQDKKDALYEEYQAKVATETRPKSRLTKTTKWEDKVKRQLGELSVSEEDIISYIHSVEYSQYGDTDREYDYEYEDDGYYDDDYYDDDYYDYD